MKTNNTKVFGLNPEVITNIQAVFKKYPAVKQAIIYGSRAKGTFRNGSDIDLTLTGDEKKLGREIYRITSDLDELLLPYSIDLSLYSEISNPNLIDHIERIGQPFYQHQ